MPPILVPEHWPTEWQETDLSEYRAGFLSGRDATGWIYETLRGPEPAAVWGLADGDVAWWCYDHLAQIPAIQQDWLERLAEASGIHGEDREQFLDAFEEAARHAPAWLLQYRWELAEQLTWHALVLKGVGFAAGCAVYEGQPKRKIECNSVYRLHNHGLFWPLLEGRRLAIVGCHVGALAERLMDRQFVTANGGRVTWTVAATIPSPPWRQTKWPHWPRIREELERTDWDLLLAAAGTLSALTCDHARKLGRKALDVGALSFVLLGQPHNIAHPFVQPGG
jgi:hypothetical protein